MLQKLTATIRSLVKNEKVVSLQLKLKGFIQLPPNQLSTAIFPEARQQPASRRVTCHRELFNLMKEQKGRDQQSPDTRNSCKTKKPSDSRSGGS